MSARVWLLVLLLVPLTIGAAEVGLGITHRHTAASCKHPLPEWMVLDGCAALLMVVLSLVDISAVQAVKAADAAAAAGRRGSGVAEGVGEDGGEVGLPPVASLTPAQRAAKLGNYACLGFTVVFLIPLFRLLWILYGIDLLYEVGTWRRQGGRAKRRLCQFDATPPQPQVCRQPRHGHADAAAVRHRGRLPDAALHLHVLLH